MSGRPSKAERRVVQGALFAYAAVMTAAIGMNLAGAIGDIPLKILVLGSFVVWALVIRFYVFGGSDE